MSMADSGKTAREVNKWRTERKEKTRAMLAAFIKSKTNHIVDPSTITNTCPVSGDWKILTNGMEYPKVRTSTIKQLEYVLLERALKSGRVGVSWIGDGDVSSDLEFISTSSECDFTPTTTTTSTTTTTMQSQAKEALLISISPDQIPQVMRMEEENRNLKRKLKIAEDRIALLEQENRKLKRVKTSVKK